MSRPLRTAAGGGAPAVPVIVSACRTAIGTAGHAFAGLTVTELAAPLLAEAADRTGGGPVDDVILGNCLGPGGNIARVAALAAGLGPEVPGVTVDRQCGSGLEAVLQGVARIRSGDAGVILAGGVESASTAPWRFWPPGSGEPPRRYVRAPFAPPGFPDPDMGVGADALARRLGISRGRQDEYAARSHARSAASSANGTFAAEIYPVTEISRDERPRPGLTEARLARLRPAFTSDGTATAGNSCGVSDGAAVLALARSHPGPGPIISVVAGAVAGGDPAMPGLAIAPAVLRLLDRPGSAGLSVQDIGAIEITEAFASVALAAIDALELDLDRVCTDGGAIGLGHPWGASGAVLLVRLVSRMLAADGPEYGLAACAIGGGQAIAMLLRKSDR